MPACLNVVILAAGLGTRMKSRKAKVLHEAGGLPLIEHVVRTAIRLAPPERVFVIVGCQGEAVRAAVESYGVGFIEQREQKGTGHALMAARERLEPLGGLLLVLYGDCPLLSADTLRRLIERQQSSGAAATVLTAVIDEPYGYGRILRDEQGLIRAIVEEKAASEAERAVKEINSGIYCFRAEPLWQHIACIRPDNPAREYYLTDVIGILRQAGFAVEPMLVANPAEVLGVNTRVELAQVDCWLRRSKARELMLEGVTIRLPETVSIDADVQVGRDTVIEPFVQLLGRTVIGEECRIGTGALLRHARLGNRVDVRAYSVIEEAHLEDDSRAGPYARLRPGTHLAAGAAVGNFVEVKNARLGAGSKANHLAYLGDADIGAGVNIGAGAITCNYDGERKHRTRIGDGVFVGSNATLVAPVELAEGCYVGAGSVITEPVPPDALALGRARQVIKEGWVKKRRAAREPASGDKG